MAIKQTTAYGHFRLLWMFVYSSIADSKSPSLYHPSPLPCCHDIRTWRGHTIFFPVALGCLNSLQKRGLITKSCPSWWGSAHRSLYRKMHILGSILVSQPLPQQSRHTFRPPCNSKMPHVSFPTTQFNVSACPPAEFSRHVLHSTESVGNVTTYIRPHKPSHFFTSQALPVHLYKGWQLIYNL